MIQVKHIKKVTSFLLLIVTALMLVACSNKDNVPYGSLTDNEYLSFEGVTITEKELYSNLRRDSQNIVNMLIEEELFKGYKDEANSLLDEVNPAEDSDAEVVQTKFDNIINTRMFNSTDVEALKSMPSINLHTNVLTFVNSLYRINSSIDRDSLKDDILSLLSGEDFGSGYYTISELRDFYLIDIQKHLYAKEKLALDLEDEESSQYVTTTNIINYYNNSVANRDDVKVFYFDFLNLNEANAALRTLGLKATSTGHYYNVPNIRLVADYEAIKQSDSETLETALEKAGLNWFDNEPWAAGATETGITESQYTNFYNAYPVSDASGNKLEAIEVLEKFVEIYNLLNEYDNNGILVNGISIVDNTVDLKDIEIIYDNDASPFELDKTYEDLSEFNSSFANYIYNDLNEDRPYSTIRAVGNKRYLAFKLSEDAVELDYVSAEKDEDDKSKFVTIDELKALLADSETKEETLKQLNSLITITGETVSEAQWAEIETIINDNIESWRLEVEKTRLTDNYVTTAIRELTQSLDIEIFDQVVRAYYNTTGEANGKNRSGDNLLTVKYEIFEEEKTYTLTVDAFYARLEANNGLEMALDLLLNEYLLNEYGEKDHGIFKDFADEIDEAKFKADYETLITNFSNDAFAQSGYPASLGRETFLLVVFGATNANEAIELGYLLPKLRELFFENSELSLPELSQDDLFANLQAYTQKQYEEFKGVSVHHMLIHFEDESGNLLDPNEYFESLSQGQIDTIKQAVVDLHAIVLDIIGTRSTGSANSDAKVPLADYQNIFNNYLINNYNETVRIDLGNFADTRFQEFKKLGLNITFENISSDITNSSNFPYAGSTLDPVFYDRAMALHELITEAVEADEDILNGGIPHFDFGGSFNVLDDLNNDLINQLDADGIMSDFGFHFILVDKIIERSSAKYEPSQSEQDNPRYQFEIDGVKYNPYNETSEYLTLEQIKYYVLGADLDALVPSSVQTAINTYFNPVNTLFNNDSMKQAIFYNFISGASFNGEQQAKFDQIVEINETTFYNYMNTIPEMDDAADYDVIYNNWNALYGGWFEAFGLK